MKQKKNGELNNMISENKKGITLIALVITVIVLLILAWVAVTIGTDNEGLFSRSNDAVEKWNHKVENENTIFRSYLDYVEEYAIQLPEGWSHKAVAMAYPSIDAEKKHQYQSNLVFLYTQMKQL